MTPDVNTFVIPGVKYIYELIRYNKLTCILINLLGSVFISNYKSSLCYLAVNPLTILSS